MLVHQVIKADRLGVVIEDQRRAQLGFLEVTAAQDAGVFDALQHLELTARASGAAFAHLGAQGGGQRVDADAALHRSDGLVLAEPVLIVLAFGEQLLQPVLAYGAVFVGWADTGFSDRLEHCAHLRAVHRSAR